MLTEHRPLTGADFMRLDLATVKQGLNTLRNDGDRNGGWLTPEQCIRFNRYVTAWNACQADQSEQCRAEVEEAIGVIFGYEVQHLSSRAA